MPSYKIILLQLALYFTNVAAAVWLGIVIGRRSRPRGRRSK